MKSNLEKVAKWLIPVGIVLIIITAVLFSWNEWHSISLGQKINDVKMGGFGAFISGVVGTLWALAGVILFYVALKDQRQDIQLNRDALQLQIQALEQQIEEFRLQTQELEETRKVFIDQTKTQKLQRFESTYFQLVNLHNEIVNNLTKSYKRNLDTIETSGRTIFETIKTRLDQFTDGAALTHYQDQTGDWIPSEFMRVQNMDEVPIFLEKYYYKTFYSEYENTLNHYFRNLYHIFKYIHTSILIDDDERKFYANIMRAQLSQAELYVIMFNSMIDGYGYPKFSYLIKVYNLLKNFNPNKIPNEAFYQYFTSKIESTPNPFPA